jgi:hypothetical protein
MGNFDIDLDFGQIFEEEIRDLFEGDGSIEVKTERDIWASTGNIAIEFGYSGHPSSLKTTDAKWWIHVLSYDNKMIFAMMWEVSKLRLRLNEMYLDGKIRAVKGGDDGKSDLWLVPIKELINFKNMDKLRKDG